MAELLTPVKKVIRRQDPRFAGHMDFDTLRNLGIGHISRYSGKLWTDHNLHDPGITILEALCFALIDLGYRVRLPLADLLAQKSPAPDKDDNFFTPAQILSNNPLTVNDFRKLLMDIPGVRNAWVEPVKYNPDKPHKKDWEEPLINAELKDSVEIVGSDQSPQSVFINGLYQVYIEPEDVLPAVPAACVPKESNEQTPSFATPEIYLLHQVWETLHAHRNLCEDFLQPVLLEKEQLRICADIELLPDADPEKVWSQIMLRIREFLAPSIRYYTLKELLDKGRSIEEVFEGRPLRPFSAGFIDTEDLEKFQRPRVIRLSDLFRVMAETEGVMAVQNIGIEGYIQCCSGESGSYEWKKVSYATAGTSQSVWSLGLTNNHVPRVDFYNSCLKFYKNRIALPELGSARRLELIGRELKPVQKALFPSAAAPANNDSDAAYFTRFDKKPAKGNFRADLGEYRSIQHDFPITYGIGEGHLVEMLQPDEQLADNQRLRKAQALQLKGYLTFFDQLLANYLAQLANLRHLFSMSPDDTPSRDAASRHTVFSQRLDSVPQVERLIRFYQNSFEDTGLNDGDALAVPVDPAIVEFVLDKLENDEDQTITLDLAYCDFAILQPPANGCAPEPVTEIIPTDNSYAIPHASFGQSFARDASGQVWQRDLSDDSLDRLNIIADACGYWFVIYSSDHSQALMSRRRYASESEARTAAGNLLIFAGLQEAYRDINSPVTGTYSFEIVYRQKDYREILDGLSESQETYRRRRNLFLDHLLARFCEQFSDFAALQFSALQQTEQDAQQEYALAKARYLSTYDELGRNRGKAFNLRKPTWLTPNISGLEYKAAALTGIKMPRQAPLCIAVDFDKPALYSYGLFDPNGTLLFQGPTTFISSAAAQESLQAFINALKQGEGLMPGEQIGRLALVNSRTGAKQAVEFKGPAEYRIQPRDAVGRFLGTNEQVVPQQAWRLTLRDAQNKLVRQSDAHYPSAEAGLGQIAAFVQPAGKKKAGKATDSGLRPQENPGNRYLDFAAFEPRVQQLPDEFFWQERHSGRRSPQTWLSAQQARAGHVEYLLINGLEGFPFLEMFPRALNPVLPGNKKGDFWLRSTVSFPDENCARLAWFDWRLAAKKKVNFQVRQAVSDWQVVLLRDENGAALAQSGSFPTPEKAAAHLDQCFERLNRKGLPYTAVEVNGTFYSVSFRNDKDALLLKSFRLFERLEEAYAAIEQTALLARQKDAYVLTGDAGNPEYTYFLRDQKGEFVAYLPETFDTPGDRDKRKKATANWFSNWEDPILVNMEPDRFRYQWLASNSKDVLLEPAAVFLSKEGALLDFQGKLASIWNKYQPDENQQADVLRQTLDPHVYTAQAEEFTREWTFELNVGDLLLKSENGFATEPLAKTALSGFKYELGTGQLIQVDKNAWKLVSGKLSANIVAPASSVVPDSLLPVLDWIRNLDQIQILDTLPVQASGAVVYPFRPQMTVKQIVKTGMPLAVRPKANPEDSFTKGACPSWYNKFCWEDWKDKPPFDCNEIPDWLELCLDGRDVTVRVDNSDENGCKSGYKYALRCARPITVPGLQSPLPGGTVLWQSTSLYDTESEAIKAFHDNFYKVLQAANNAANYQPAGQCIAWEAAPVSQEQAGTDIVTAKPCPPCPSGAPFVEVPYPTQLTLSQHTLGQANLLALLARSYPVFQVLVPDEQCGCACDQAGCCADQAAQTADCNGQAAAASVQYKFHVYSPNFSTDSDQPTGQVLWESPRCFDNPAEAWAGFRMLLRMLANGDACRVIDNQCSDCDKALGIMEVLLEKTQFEPVAINTCNLTEFYRQSAHARAFYIAPVFSCDSDHDEDLRFRIRVVGRNYLVARHPGVYINPSAACDAMKEAVELIHEAVQDPEWCTLDNSNKAGLKTGVYLKKVEKTDGYVLQILYKPLQGSARILLESLDRIAVPQGATEADIDRALSELAGRFCALLKNPALNLHLSSPKDCAPYTFDLVDSASSSGVLAENPGRYATLTEAEQVLERIKDCLFAESMYLVEHILLRPGVAGFNYCNSKVPVEKCSPGSGGNFTWPKANGEWDWKKGNCLKSVNPRTDAGEPTLLPPFPLPVQTDCLLLWQDKPVGPSCPAPKEKSSYLPFTDPYSCWATVVLPGYTPRFSNPDFRRFVEDNLRKEAPAHIALCIRWLSPEGICCFEALYKRWTNWLRTGQKNCALSASECPSCSKDDLSFDVQGLNEMDPVCALETFLQYTIFDLEASPIDSSGESNAPCNCTPPETQGSRSNIAVGPKDEKTVDDLPVCLRLFHRGALAPGDCKPPEQTDEQEPPIQIVTDIPAPEVLLSKPVDLTKAGDPKTSKTAESPVPAKKDAGAPDIKLILKRQNAYKTRVGPLKEAFERGNHAPDIFEKASHYILHNAAIGQLPPILRLLAPEGSAKGKKLPPVLYDLLQLALFSALDKLALEHPASLPEDACTSLRETSNALLSAGLSPAKVLEDWDPAFLAHHAQVHSTVEIQSILESEKLPVSSKKKTKK